VFAQAEPVVRKATNLAISGEVSTTELARLFVNLRQTHGWQRLTELIYNTTGAINGFDKHGHYGRALVTLSNCLQYIPETAGTSGCSARFSGTNAAEPQEASASIAQLLQLLEEHRATQGGGTSAEAGGRTNGLGTAESAERTAPAERGSGEREPGLGEATPTEGTEPLLDYLLGQ
jgi:hypothetical protein